MVDQNIKAAIESADNAGDIMDTIEGIPLKKDKLKAITKYRAAALSIVEGVDDANVANVPHAQKAYDILSTLKSIKKQLRSRSRSRSAGGGKTRKQGRKTSKRKTSKRKSHKKRH
jgi:hypothetical protein